MRARVVYESIFGNTRAIAEAIADGLRGACDVEVHEISAAPTDLDGLDLLIVGGPTHAWSMTRAGTRDGARKQARAGGKEPISAGIGLREWIARLPARAPPRPIHLATFDTVIRPSGKFPFGSAAHPAARRLLDRHLHLLAEPEHFLVQGPPGPLVAGEVGRARAFGQRLAESLRDPRPVRLPPRRRPAERAGDLFGNLAALVILNLHALWRPLLAGFVTDAFALIVPWFTLACGAAVLGNALALGLRRDRAELIVDLLVAAARLAAAIVLLRVFPFDFAAFEIPWLDTFFRVILVLGVVEAAIRTLLAGFRFLTR